MLVSTSIALGIVGGGMLIRGADDVDSKDPAHAINRVSISGQTDSWAFTALGRIESVSGLRHLGTPVNGTIQEIAVSEGEEVHRGQVVASVECKDRFAGLEAAREQVQMARQDVLKDRAGSRSEDIRAGKAELAKARAELADAASSYDKLRRLTGVASVREIESGKAGLDHATAGVALATAKLEEINRGTRTEDRTKDEEALELAEANCEQAKALVDQCSVKSPIEGVVVRVNLRAGEQVSQIFPNDIIDVVGTDAMQVRAEIDERYVDRVSLGQDIEFWAESRAERFKGKVIRLSAAMGKKSTIANAPADKADRDVREVIIEPNPGPYPRLHGMRVIVGFWN